MTIEAIVAKYGLAALFAGAAVEGEAAVIAGGVLAHHGLFPMWAAMLAAATGSFSADQGWFFAGRRMRDHRWVKAARAKPAFARAQAMLERYPIAFIFAFRFIYGFRTISPIAIGTAGVAPRLFAVVNAASAITWGVIFCSIGYVFGHAFEAVVGRLAEDHRLWWVVGGLIAAGLTIALVHRYRSRTA